MGPDELDDLLASIRAEGKNDSALALYEGTRETDIVDESVDERILKILGLDGVYDIDYGTYLTLLKEKLAASRLPGTKIPQEEDELILNEFKRVKGKVGRFKIKKKKITSENIGVTGPVKVSTEKFYLTSKAVIPQPELSNVEGSQDIKDINEALDKLLESIIGQNKETKKKAEEDKKADEKRKRTKRESELEKPLAKAVSLVKKIVAPFQSILDRIMKFIQFTLLGYFVDKILKWFADPKNEGKIKVIGRFLKDWWPSLLIAYGLFATPFGKFIRTTLTLLRGWVPQIAKFIAANPWLLAAAAATTGAIVKIKESERMKPLVQENQKEIDKTLSNKDSPWYQKLGASFANQNLNAPGGPKNPMGLTAPGSGYNGGGLVRRKSFFGGGQVDRAVNVNDIAFNGGGGITDDTGLRVTGAGPDTQLIAAQPGEIMMSKKTVDKHGANFFLGLNKNAGGTNIPRMVNNIQLAQGGGMIGGFGRVMSPRTGGQEQWASRGARSVLQMFGMNMPGTEKSANYSQNDIGRYNKLNRSRQIQTGNAWDPNPLSGGYYGMSPTIKTTSTAPRIRSSTPTSINRAKAIQSSVDNARQLRNMLKYIPFTGGYRDVLKNAEDLGTNDIKYNQKLEKQINEVLGPQSRAMPPGTPTIISRSQTIVLPPQTMPGKKQSFPVKTGTQIPDVSTVATIPHREMVIQSLGIGDLMGVG